MKVLSKINDFILNISGALLVAMLGLVLIQIVSRYVLDTSVAQTDELSRYAMIWAALLGSTIGIRTGSHVNVTVITEILPEKIQVFLKYVVHFAVGVFSLLLLWQGVLYTIHAMNQISTTLPIRMGYVTAIIPITGFIGLLYTIENIYKEIQIDKGRAE